ncbi:MAG: DUF6061 family protein [Eubacteriales bacterium]
MILIATIAVESKAAVKTNRQSELGHLIGSAPVSYSDRILRKL